MTNMLTKWQTEMNNTVVYRGYSSSRAIDKAISILQRAPRGTIATVAHGNQTWSYYRPDADTVTIKPLPWGGQ
mgnify:CR=1 FL=1